MPLARPEVSLTFFPCTDLNKLESVDAKDDNMIQQYIIIYFCMANDVKIPPKLVLTGLLRKGHDPSGPPLGYITAWYNKEKTARASACIWVSLEPLYPIIS